MNTRLLSGSGLIVISTLLLFLGCAACGSGDRTEPSGGVDSTTSSDTTRGVETDPVQPDEQRGVDLGRWHDMTRSDFDTQFADFTRFDPPVIRAYGICDSIVCHFPSAAPEAIPEILICHLDGVYRVEDAFRLLGIDIQAVPPSTEPWVTVGGSDTRFSSLQYRAEGTQTDRTSQILLQFNRNLDR
ncbi:MAG: hypothetical protein RBU27_08445 [Bacteroidota bacterium]|jgi:hypothetical protein|nr:hypothetical protein [Bacteroidota bacterium]